MFNLPAPADLARAQQLRRTLARAHTAAPGTVLPAALSGAAAFDDLYVPLGLGARGPWRQSDFLGPLPHDDDDDDNGPSRFQDLDGSPGLPRSMSSRPPSSPRDYASRGYDRLSPPRRSDYSASHDRLPFSKAAAALATALKHAIDYCGRLAKQFEDDTWHVAAYADPKVIAYLWTAKLAWNGVLALDYAKDPSLTAPPGTVTYDLVVRRLLAALAEMKSAAPPRLACLEEAQSKISPEEVKVAMKKLGVSFSGIVEFAESARRDRERIHALNRELVATDNLLCEIADVWVPLKNKAAGAGGKAKVEDEFTGWPDYRGE